VIEPSKFETVRQPQGREGARPRYSTELTDEVIEPNRVEISDRKNFFDGNESRAMPAIVQLQASKSRAKLRAVPPSGMDQISFI